MHNLTSISTTATMSSREIAELTGKEHRHVIADIRKMLDYLEIDSAEFSALYIGDNGRSLPCFNLPKRECLILVSGYSTPMRANIIDRWQALEASATMPAPVAITTAEMLLAQAQQMVDAERRVATVEEKIKLLEAKQPHQQNYFTVIGYARYAGEVVSNNQAVAIGRRAAKLSRDRGIPIGDTTDPRYGFVHTYFVEVLAEVFADYCEIPA